MEVNKNELLAIKKSILDLLYLYPQYNSEQEIKELRFDEEFMQEDLNIERLNKFSENHIFPDTIGFRSLIIPETYR